MLKIAFIDTQAKEKKNLILTIAAKQALGEMGIVLDKKWDGVLSRILKASPTFKGEKGQILSIPAPVPALEKLVLIGIGDPAEADALALEEAGGAAVLAFEGKEEASLCADRFASARLAVAETAAALAMGARLRAYRFDKYRTTKKEDKKPLAHLNVVCADPAGAKKAFAQMDASSQGQFMARDLVSEPPNVLDPEALMKQAVALTKLGVKVEVLDEKQMKKLGMGSLLGVAQGSDKPPYLVALSWQGAPKAKDKRPVAFVGKGVTFDTGGISLKPGPGMGDMKFDMGGAAAVIGAMKALALRKAKANVVGVVGLVENMPSGHAMRPGDVVTSASGQTIEVLNTDAEGRLVLADALWYAQKTYKPRLIVDLATLTGAMLISLGHEFAGLFANDDQLATQLTAAAAAVGEPVWRLPMTKSFDKMLDSPIADMKNIGGREGGSCSAACFLQRFVNKGTPWAHLDMAWTVWSEKDLPRSPKGATGYGVRLLDRFVADHCEA